MNRNSNGGRGDPVPRTYDKSSGEYRPAARQEHGAAKAGRSDKFQTPQRRADMRRRRRHRALLCFYLFTFVAVIVAAVVLSLTVLFKIDSIQVSGTSRYPAQDIIAAAGIRTGDNLFLANTRQASLNIQKKYPYIGTADVSRRLPAQILITIKEDAVSGALEYQGKYVIVNSAGEALEFTTQLPTNCPSIKGVQISKAELGKTVVYQDSVQQTTLQSLTAALAQNKMQKITTIDMTKTYKIVVVYDNRIQLNLGTGSDMDYKLRFGKSLLDGGKFKENEKGELNLSVASETNMAFFDPDYSVSSSPSQSSASSKKTSSIKGGSG